VEGFEAMGSWFLTGNGKVEMYLFGVEIYQGQYEGL